MTTQKKKLGDFAENLVCKYLKDKGCKIIVRNYRKPWGEIDIIAKNKKAILFIEVKSQTNKNKNYFTPEDHFDYKKKLRLLKICSTYLLENNYLQDVEHRIDLAAVDIDYSLHKAKLRYYKNVVEAT